MKAAWDPGTTIQEIVKKNMVFGSRWNATLSPPAPGRQANDTGFLPSFTLILSSLCF
jgi:hypothetical protein